MSMSRQKVLIVDDDPDDRMIITEAIKSCDANVECYELQNGNGVSEYLSQKFTSDLPSFILLDLNMPGKDGKEVIKELKSDSRYISIPIIVLTTASSTRERNDSYNLGANCFITKPQDYSSFKNLLAAVTYLYCRSAMAS